MVLLRQLAIRLFDVLLRCIGLNPKDIIVLPVLFGDDVEEKKKKQLHSTNNN